MYLFNILESILKAYFDATVVIGMFGKSLAMIDKSEKH